MGAPFSSLFCRRGRCSSQPASVSAVSQLAAPTAPGDCLQILITHVLYQTWVWVRCRWMDQRRLRFLGHCRATLMAAVQTSRR